MPSSNRDVASTWAVRVDRWIGGESVNDLNENAIWGYIPKDYWVVATQIRFIFSLILGEIIFFK